MAYYVWGSTHHNLAQITDAPSPSITTAPFASLSLNNVVGPPSGHIDSQYIAWVKDWEAKEAKEAMQHMEPTTRPLGTIDRNHMSAMRNWRFESDPYPMGGDPNEYFPIDMSHFKRATVAPSETASAPTGSLCSTRDFTASPCTMVTFPCSSTQSTSATSAAAASTIINAPASTNSPDSVSVDGDSLCSTKNLRASPARWVTFPCSYTHSPSTTSTAADSPITAAPAPTESLHARDWELGNGLTVHSAGWHPSRVQGWELGNGITVKTGSTIYLAGGWELGNQLTAWTKTEFPTKTIAQMIGRTPTPEDGTVVTVTRTKTVEQTQPLETQVIASSPPAFIPPPLIPLNKLPPVIVSKTRTIVKPPFITGKMHHSPVIHATSAYNATRSISKRDSAGQLILSSTNAAASTTEPLTKGGSTRSVMKLAALVYMVTFVLSCSL